MSVHIFRNGEIIEETAAQTNANTPASYTAQAKETVQKKQANGLTLSVHNALKNLRQDHNVQDNRRRLVASHIMTTALMTATNNCSIDSAIDKINNCDCSHIIIIDEYNSPLAIFHLNQLMALKAQNYVNFQAVANEAVPFVNNKTLVREIALIFIEHKYTAICVVDENAQLCGIISQNDLMSLLVSSPNQKITV